MRARIRVSSPWLLAAATAWSISACGDDPEPGGTGTDTEVGTGTDTGSSSETGTDTQTGTGTGTGYPEVCDSGESGGPGTQLCFDCVACASVGECAEEVAACDASQECLDVQGCRGSCWSSCEGESDCNDTCVGDVDTPGSCYGDSPEGAALYEAFRLCAACEQCPVNCDPDGSRCN